MDFLLPPGDVTTRALLDDVTLPGRLYEALMEPRAAGSEGAAAARARQRSGTWYTPEGLVRPTVERVLGAVVGWRPDLGPTQPVTLERLLALRILDPAMGSGIFLLHAHRFLLRVAMQSLPGDHGAEFAPHLLGARILERCLNGVDLDPTAVALARACLWIECRGGCRPEALELGLVRGDALLGEGGVEHGAHLEARHHLPHLELPLDPDLALGERRRWRRPPEVATVRAAQEDRRRSDVVLSADGQQALPLDGLAQVALPVYEGRMLGPYDFSQKEYIAGRGRRAVWRIQQDAPRRLMPQFLIARDEARRVGIAPGLKLGFLAIGSATNARAMTCCPLEDLPCGNAVPTLLAGDERQTLLLAMLLNSLCFDFALRRRLVGNNLNRFILEELPLPGPEIVERLDPSLATVLEHVVALSFAHLRFAPVWKALRAWLPAGMDWRRSLARHPTDRMRRRCQLEAVAAWCYGIDSRLFRRLIGGCVLSVEDLNGAGSHPEPGERDPRGVWCLDRQEPPERRLPVLALCALKSLEQQGVARFLGAEGGEGWRLPAEFAATEPDALPSPPLELHAARLERILASG